MVCSLLIRRNVKSTIRCFKTGNFKPPWDVLFFGTDDFSLVNLQELYAESKTSNLLGKLEVVTTSKNSVVHTFAQENNLKIHTWPVTLLCNSFHIGLVASFGNLIPKNVINAFPLGMLNVHASLLPRWRGAAPIVYAILNGDNVTGISIMKIRPKKFDIGEIIAQDMLNITYEMNGQDLQRQLAKLGAQTLIKCIRKLPNILGEAREQSTFGITYAPKIESSISLVKWNEMTALQIYNLSRALHGIFDLRTTFNGVNVKLKSIGEHTHLYSSLVPGMIVYDKYHNILCVQCCDGKWVSIKQIGISGKKMMEASDFNNGYISKLTLNSRIFR